VLRECGYTVRLLDCLDRNHPRLLSFQRLSHAKDRGDGTGHFYKEFIDKPTILQSVPRRYGRYGIPYFLVQKEVNTFTTPDVIFVTSGMTYWYPGVLEMISLLKQRFPKVPVILGGIYASLFPEHARKKSGADEVICGAGEQACLRIADEITGNPSDAHRYREMADLPGPAYDLYPRMDSVALLTSHGCPYRCPFCASRILSGEYRRRQPSRVMEEIEWLHNVQDVRHFAFYDDALLYRKDEHLVPILEEIVARNMGVCFHTPNGIQPREMDDRLARLMHESGFKTIRLSYESKSRERQERMGLKVRDDDLIRAVGFLKEAGFDSRQLGSYVLMGLPGQDAGEVLESMVFVLSLGIQVNLASFSPIPGTPCWQEAVASGLLDADADPLLTNNSIYPLKSGDHDYDTFVALGTLAATANRILKGGSDPLSHETVKTQMKRIMERVG